MLKPCGVWMQTITTQIITFTPVFSLMFRADVNFDPVKCGIDTDELDSPTMLSCQELFDSGGNLRHFLNYTSADATKFCHLNCQKRLPDLLNRFIEDCNIPQNAIVRRNQNDPRCTYLSWSLLSL